MAKLKKVVYISNEDYLTLVTTGTVVINGTTVTYDADCLYVTPETVASDTADGLMSVEDKNKIDSLKTVATTGSYNDLTNKPTLGTAAAKNYTTSVTSGSGDLVTAGAVYTAIDNLPEPMVFKGGATITKSGNTYTLSVTTPSSTADIKEGYTYKVTSAPSSDANFKVGDTLVANQNNPGTNPQSNWTLIPSGDEPSGTVTSVGMSLPTNEFSVTNSPVTSSGTLTASWKTQNANVVFAGPSSGSAAAPGFRALTAADIPDLSGTYVTSVKSLDTTATTPQSVNNEEAIAGTGKITLHKVAKTGTYSDLNGTPIVDTSISTSSTNAVQNKAIPLYIASRGENLLTNGTCLLGNNYNFSALTFDGSDTYYAGGCFKHVGGRIEPKTDEFMPVDVSQTYEISYYAKSSSSTSTLYDYLAMYDIDKLEIGASHIMWIAGSTTTLAQELKNGDTKVYLASVAGFNQSASATYQRGLIFWNYTNSYGYTYGTETYSRNKYTNLWANSSSFDTTNNTITLSSVWNKGTIPAGTAVSQSNDGSSYTYMTTGAAGSTNWFQRKATMSGVGKNNASGKFREGTAFVKLGWLIDQNSESNVTWKLSTLSVAKYIPSLSNTMTTNTAQTVSGTKTFSTAPLLNNSVYLNGKNASGTIKRIIGITSSNNIFINPDATGNVTIESTVRPNSSGSYDLGLSDKKWRDLYLSRNLTDGTNSVTVANIVTKNNPSFNIGGDSEAFNAVNTGGQHLKLILDSGGGNGSEIYYDDHNLTAHSLLLPSATSGTLAVTDDIKNATLTIQKNGTTVNTFTANASSDVTANITVPTAVSELTNDRYVRYDVSNQSLTSTQKTNANTNTGSLPGYYLSLTTNTSGVLPLKFLSCNYTNNTSEDGIFVKLSLISAHGNTSSYAYMEDVVISVTYTGTVTTTVSKNFQTSCTYDSATHYYGDVFYTKDTTNKVVDFFVLTGQYSKLDMTPYMRLGKSSLGTVTQPTSAAYYSSGTKTWATEGKYIISPDLANYVPTSRTVNGKALSSNVSLVHSDIGNGYLNIGDGQNYQQFRTTDTWHSGIYYHTTGDEALVFGNQNTRTSWIFANTNPVSRADWTTLTPSLQIKNGKVAINKLIANSTQGSYELDVNGTINGTTIYENGTTLANTYLGKTAKAADADKLDGNDSSYFYPASNPNGYTSVTETTVSGWGFTKNAGTVTSVGAGTGLSISGTASTTPTVNIASGYKLPTTTEWSGKQNALPTTTTAGQVLKSTSTAGTVEWGSVTGGDNYYATTDFSSGNDRTKIATGYSSGTASSTYDLYVPNATSTQGGILTTDAQTFVGRKTFSSNPIISGIYNTTKNNNVVMFQYDTTNGSSVVSDGHFTAYGDDDFTNPNLPPDMIGVQDLDAHYFNTGITLVDNDGEEGPYKLSFPNKSGTFATVKFRHNIYIANSTTLQVSFSVITSDATACTTWALVRSALYSAGVNATGFRSATAICPAFGQFSVSGYTRMIMGVYVTSTTATSLGVRYLTLASTSSGTMTIQSAPSTGTTTVSPGSTIYDVVEKIG